MVLLLMVMVIITKQLHKSIGIPVININTSIHENIASWYLLLNHYIFPHTKKIGTWVLCTEVTRLPSTKTMERPKCKERKDLNIQAYQ